MVSPSQSSTFEAIAPIDGSAASGSTAADTQRSCGRASLLRNATYSPLAFATPRLQPPANPRLPPDSTTRASGTAWRIRSADPSPEWLSTTISSSRSSGQSICRRWCRQVIVSSAPR